MVLFIGIYPPNWKQDRFFFEQRFDATTLNFMLIRNICSDTLELVRLFQREI